MVEVVRYRDTVNTGDATVWNSGKANYGGGLMPAWEKRPGGISKLYVWSIVFEPLLFFEFAHHSVTGVAVNLGRMLQILVLIGLALRWSLSKKPLTLFNPASPLYVNYTCYFVLAVTAGLLGLVTGSYALEEQYSPEHAASLFAAIIRNPSFRPIFEYFIAFYYFAYFVVLPRYLLNSTEGIRYFFKVFKTVFVLCIALGTIDLILDGFGYEWLPRQLSDGRHVGFRFHGVAGEPRDAFVYLMFGFVILTMREFILTGRPLGKFWLVGIFAAALLTQSTSGLLGLLFAGLLVLGFSLKYLSPRYLISASIFVLVLAGLVYASWHFSTRIQHSILALTEVFGVLDSGGQIPPVLLGQMNNIFPLWDMYQKLLHGEIVPLLLGSGLGSSSIINNNIGYWHELTNPHTQLVRTLYESGLIGLYFFIMSFVYPVRILTVHLSPNIRRRFLLLTFLLLGAFLAHRSATLFIYLGVLMAVMTNYARQVNDAASYAQIRKNE